MTLLENHIILIDGSAALIKRDQITIYNLTHSTTEIHPTPETAVFVRHVDVATCFVLYATDGERQVHIHFPINIFNYSCENVLVKNPKEILFGSLMTINIDAAYQYIAGNSMATPGKIAQETQAYIEHYLEPLKELDNSKPITVHMMGGKTGSTAIRTMISQYHEIGGISRDGIDILLGNEHEAGALSELIGVSLIDKLKAMGFEINIVEDKMFENGMVGFRNYVVSAAFGVKSTEEPMVEVTMAADLTGIEVHDGSITRLMVLTRFKERIAKGSAVD
jgi:hypothetical protein